MFLQFKVLRHRHKLGFKTFQAFLLKLKRSKRNKILLKDLFIKRSHCWFLLGNQVDSILENSFWIFPNFIIQLRMIFDQLLELVSKELNHSGRLGVIVCSRFVLFCSFWRLFTIKIFPFSFWKIITTIFFLLHKIQTPGINMQNGRQVI